MKIWTGYGSEHSYDLVMIGYFIDEVGPKRAEQKFARLASAAESELPEQNWGSPSPRFSKAMVDLLTELNLYSMSRSDIEHFAYEHKVEVRGRELHITTDEGDVQGFLKVLIDEGARVEVYSAHDWTDEGVARQKSDETPAPTDNG